MPENTMIIAVPVPAGATDVYIPVKERCKLRNVRICTNANRGAGAVTAAKGATVLGTLAALSATPGAVDNMTMDKTKDVAANIFAETESIKISFAAGTATVATIMLKVDPFCIQQFHQS